MTKEEFRVYVNSFNCLPGLYSEDDIYKIGVTYKKLPKEEKNWSSLASQLGWNGTGESLRCFIKARMRKDGTLPKNKRELSGRTIEEIEDEDLISLKQELMKQQQQTRDEWTAYRRLIRQDARIDTLKDLIKDAIADLQNLPRIDFNKSKKVSTTNEAVLLLSDLHIGVECDNFYNKYNISIAQKRVNKVVEDTIDYCSKNNVCQLNVVNLGDMIHGIIHTSARVEQETDVVNQIIIASEIVANALNKLQEAAPRVVYRSVIDNHSRAIASKDEAIENENFSKLIDWFLQERLKHSSVIFENDNIDDGLGKFDLICGKKVMFAHGHQDNINQAFQHFIGASREFIDYALLGHYHCEKAKSYQGAKVIVNGSIVGTEQYALSKRLFSSPSQTLLIFEDKNLMNISIDLSIN